MTILRGFEFGRAVPFLAAMIEMLWIYPWFVWAGELKVLGWIEPPLTLGSAVVLLVIAQLLSHHTLLKNWALSLLYLAVLPALALLLAVVVRLDMGGGYALWDLDWIQYALENQTLIYGGLTLGALLLWRGISAGRGSPSFDDLYRKFLVGLTALVLLLVVQSSIIQLNSSSDGSTGEIVASTGFYVLGFFAMGLLSLGLINLQSTREEMLRREESFSAPDQRWFSMLLGVVIVILAGPLITASAFSFNLATSLLRTVGALAGWLLTAFIYIVALPVGVAAAGVIYVLRFLTSLVGQGEPLGAFSPPNPEEVRRVMEGQDVGGIPPEALLIFRWGLGVLVVLLVVLILGRALRQHWRAREEESVEEVSESLWSWEGFKSDLRSFLSRLFGRFERKKGVTPVAVPLQVALDADEATDREYTVREIYQGLLREGRRAGLPRRHPETPYEYQERLKTGFSPGISEIQAITEAYTAQRYGLVDASLEHQGVLNQLWRRLLSVLRSVPTETNQG